MIILFNNVFLKHSDHLSSVTRNMNERAPVLHSTADKMMAMRADFLKLTSGSFSYTRRHNQKTSVYRHTHTYTIFGLLLVQCKSDFVTELSICSTIYIVYDMYGHSVNIAIQTHTYTHARRLYPYDHHKDRK
jgi:hypothetical protein